MRKLCEHAIAGGLLTPKAGVNTGPITKGGVLASKAIAGESRWEDMPKGWTPASRAKFGKSLTGVSPECEAAEDDSMPGFVDKCMARIGDHVDDPGAFCASLKDRISGTTHWRGKGK